MQLILCILRNYLAWYRGYSCLHDRQGFEYPPSDIKEKLWPLRCAGEQIQSSKKCLEKQDTDEESHIVFQGLLYISIFDTKEFLASRSLTGFARRCAGFSLWKKISWSIISKFSRGIFIIRAKSLYVVSSRQSTFFCEQSK